MIISRNQPKLNIDTYYNCFRTIADWSYYRLGKQVMLLLKEAVQL